MWKWECVGVGPVCVCVYVCVCVIVPLLCGGCGAPMFVLVEMDTCMGGGVPSFCLFSFLCSVVEKLYAIREVSLSRPSSGRFGHRVLCHERWGPVMTGETSMDAVLSSAYSFLSIIHNPFSHPQPLPPSHPLLLCPMSPSRRTEECC